MRFLSKKALRAFYRELKEGYELTPSLTFDDVLDFIENHDGYIKDYIWTFRCEYRHSSPCLKLIGTSNQHSDTLIINFNGKNY